MEYFHHYLVGRSFDLLTDHKPIVPLSTAHTKTLNRLQLKMQDMHPDIGFIPGKLKVVSDFLSQYDGMGVSKENLTPQCGVGIAAVEITHDSIFPRQQKDHLCNRVRDFLKTQPHDELGHYYKPLR